MRKLQKKSLKLAGVGSGGLREEAVSTTSKCKVRQHVLMQKLQQVLQKVKPREFIKVAPLSNRLQGRPHSVLFDEDAI